jgi:predicted ATP-grasp superfamily ATP-dependent carboligase
VAEFVDGVEMLLKEGGFAVAMPASDASLLAVSRHRERIEPHARLGLPPHETVERCFDKWELDRCAREAGLPGPETVLCTNEAEALEAARGFGFPVLVKSRRAVAFDRGGNAIRQRGSRPVAGEGALGAALQLYGLPCLVQRREAGTILSVGGVATEDGLLGLACSRYSRVFPPDGGAVCFSATVESPAGLEARVAALVSALGWRGVFELELLERADPDPDHSHWGAIDFNPRPYGSMALAVAAGAPLPALWCEHLLGRAPIPARARAGLRYRWEDADLLHLLWQLRRGHPGAALAVLRPRSRVVHSFFRLSDPLPLFARLLGMLRRRLKSRRQKS